MAKDEFYLGPGKGAFDGLEKVHVDLGASYQHPASKADKSNVAALSAEVKVELTEPHPPSGLPKSFWKSLGVGQE